MGITGGGLRYQGFLGKEIAHVADALATLRITVFRDFPFLYDGSMEYEREYLQTYINSESSFLFAVFDGEQLVGATTCILLAHETPEVQAPFLQKGIDLNTVFYFGESILLQEYRGLGLGNLFFKERELHARLYTPVDIVCFCAVNVLLTIRSGRPVINPLMTSGPGGDIPKKLKCRVFLNGKTGKKWRPH